MTITTALRARTRTPAVVLALLGTSVALLTGCGGTGAGSAHVASLPPAGGTGSDRTAGSGDSGGPGGSDDSNGSGGSGSAGASDTGDRPVLRVDDSEARRTALADAWNQCLLAHGAKRPTSGMAAAIKPGDVYVKNPPPAAEAACLHLEPVQPPALDAATNPDFHAQSLRYVGCMRAGGLYVTLTDDHSPSWTYQPGHVVPDDEAAISQRCLVTAFGAK